ncbi:DUF373 family protein, partial [Metallosphaera hakonensis]
SLKRELLKVREPTEVAAVMTWSKGSGRERVGNLRELDKLSSSFKPPAIIVVGEGVERRVPLIEMRSSSEETT